VNTVRRDLGEQAVREVSAILAESIDAGLEHRDEALDYALGFGRGMDAERGDQFIGMYVNELTRDYGDEGRQAIRELYARADVLVDVQFVE
jgi:1,4-dihydroxy-6-naphthoate synthase